METAVAISYMEIVKGLKSETILNVGRSLLIEFWSSDQWEDADIEKLMEDVRIYIKESMRQMVQLEKPHLFDDEEAENIITEPETRSMF